MSEKKRVYISKGGRVVDTDFNFSEGVFTMVLEKDNVEYVLKMSEQMVKDVSSAFTAYNTMRYTSEEHPRLFKRVYQGLTGEED